MSFILVIDDRPAKRRQYLDLAASVEMDVNIEGFANPRAAIEASADMPPDLVILGRTMPSLNGVRAMSIQAHPGMRKHTGNFPGRAERFAAAVSRHGGRCLRRHYRSGRSR